MSTTILLHHKEKQLQDEPTLDRRRIAESNIEKMANKYVRVFAWAYSNSPTIDVEKTFEVKPHLYTQLK